MLEPWRIFNEIIRGPWNTSGLDVQWKALLVDGTPYLAFQASASKMDWLNNFWAFVEPYKRQERKLLVHAGFARAWKSCNDEVVGNFAALCEISNQRPVIVGHSFGGAMSVLAAEDFNYRTKLRPMVVTFGAPKVLWGESSAEAVRLCADFTMYSQRNDPVPLCPPLPGYKHPSQIKIGDKFCFFKLFNPNKYHQLYGSFEEYLK